MWTMEVLSSLWSKRQRATTNSKIFKQHPKVHELAQNHLQQETLWQFFDSFWDLLPSNAPIREPQSPPISGAYPRRPSRLTGQGILNHTRLVEGWRCTSSLEPKRRKPKERTTGLVFPFFVFTFCVVGFLWFMKFMILFWWPRWYALFGGSFFRHIQT